MAERATVHATPVFLSYSRVDRHAAIALRSALERSGLSVFHDEEAIRVGDQWMTRLQDALQGCSAFVVLVGRDGVRRWVGAEVQVALELLLRLTRINDEGRHTRQRISRDEAGLVAGDGNYDRGERAVRLLSCEHPGTGGARSENAIRTAALGDQLHGLGRK
jgi:hypothetical protein